MIVKEGESSGMIEPDNDRLCIGFDIALSD